MANHIPSGLLEASVVVGASSERLREVFQEQLQGKLRELPLLEAEVLQVHAPPFVSKETVSNGQSHTPAFTRAQKRRSFKKKRERPVVSANDVAKSNETAVPITEDLSVPKDIDVIALPQLCFPEGLRIASESKEDSYHFLVFTDVFGNQSHGVVVQFYRPIHDGGMVHNGHWSAKNPRLYSAYVVCVISKYPYYSALRDCLSCVLSQLKTCRFAELEERVKEFSAKLALVPVPPPGQLHVVFTFKPLQIVLPSREDKDRPAVDHDLHLPFLCFQPEQVLQIITAILTEQRVVFFSSDWAKLTLMAECFMLFIYPLHWQHPYVPLLSGGMLDFIMAPTAYLMGCHVNHLEEVAAETDDLVLIDVDSGTVSSSDLDLPEIPQAARNCFLSRTAGLQFHYDLELCHLGSSIDMNDLRAQRRQWQLRLNTEILQVSLELIVNIFREVQDHLNYEHRVFNHEEFLRSREPTDHTFYQKVLDTHIFHSFLRDRLNRKMDAFHHMERKTRSEAQKWRTDVLRRPPMQEMARKYNGPENRLSKRLGMSLPNLLDEKAFTLQVRRTSLKTMSLERNGFKIPQKPVKTFKLPEFPPPLSYHYVQNYYAELINLLGRAVALATPEDSALLARYYYLRGLVNSVTGKRLDAIGDFQNLYKTDTDIFPAELVNSLVDTLSPDERAQADRRSELKRLISKVKKDHEAQPNDRGGSVKKFELPRTHMQLEDFVRRVQESGIVKDQGTIGRLFEALTVDSCRLLTEGCRPGCPKQNSVCDCKECMIKPPALEDEG